LYESIITAKQNVITFAPINAISLIFIPWSIHKKTPKTNIAYIIKDMPDVSFVFITFNAWGTKENVVNTAANIPIVNLLPPYDFTATAALSGGL
jgi:hypothetical protein